MAKVSMLEAVKIQARAHALVGRALAESHAEFAASRTTERDAHPSAEQGSFAYPVESKIVESTPQSLAIDMTACEFAVNAKLRPSWDFARTQTQMEGAAFCDFRWRLRKTDRP